MIAAINPNEGASLLQFREFDRILARLADATEECARGDNRAIHIALILVERHNMGHLLRTVLAERSPAKHACPVRRSFAVPAVHSNPPEEARAYSTGVIVLQNRQPALRRLWRCGKMRGDVVRSRSEIGSRQPATR